MNKFNLCDEIKETSREMSDATCALGAIISAAIRGDDDPKSYLSGLLFVWTELYKRVERLGELLGTDSCTIDDLLRPEAETK